MSAPSASPAAWSRLLAKCPGVTLPPRGDMTAEEWIETCRRTLTMPQWLRLAAAVLEL